MIQFTISTKLPTTPERLYKTWLDSVGHAAMTGVNASISDQVEDTFSVYNDYIVGRNLNLIPHSRIVQTWRTSEFDEGDEDSHLDITFEADGNETLLTINHTNIPDESPDYAAGWQEYYFAPMRIYFSGKQAAGAS
jgi:activator of HSP90 ATPase